MSARIQILVRVNRLTSQSELFGVSCRRRNRETRGRAVRAPARSRRYSSKRTRPIWLVPRNAPLPKFCSWRTTPFTGIVLPFAGLGTVPLNRPEDVVIVRLVVLVVPTALLFAPRTTSLVKLSGRFPLANQTMPVWMFNTGTPLVNVYF